MYVYIYICYIHIFSSCQTLLVPICRVFWNSRFRTSQSNTRRKGWLPWLKGESVPTQFGVMDLVKHKGNNLKSLAKPIRKSTKA